MQRISNIYKYICSIENLLLADKKARKGKSWQYGIQIHDINRESNLFTLHTQLINKIYSTSAYTIFTVHEPKERVIYRLPYFPDRITHHAIMNLLEPVFVSVFTKDTFSCIKGRGIHAAANAVKQALRDVPGTQYCLKMDLRKFYPSIDHKILKLLLRRKIKDNNLLWLLDEIIDSAPGLPIGNYLSQYLANFYLTYFDHWIKEEFTEDGRSFSIIEATIKDEFCNYKYEVIKGIGIGDQHNVTGSGIVKDSLLTAFANFNVHLACINEVFKHSKIEVEDIDMMHGDELTSLYRVHGVKVKASKGYDTIRLSGMKYVSSAGGWMEIKSPEITLDSLSSYKWWNELKTATDNAREEVSLYKEGNYTPVEKEEEEPDERQGDLFKQTETDVKTEKEFEEAVM